MLQRSISVSTPFATYLIYVMVRVPNPAAVNPPLITTVNAAGASVKKQKQVRQALKVNERVLPPLTQY